MATLVGNLRIPIWLAIVAILGSWSAPSLAQFPPSTAPSQPTFVNPWPPSASAQPALFPPATVGQPTNYNNFDPFAPAFRPNPTPLNGTSNWGFGNLFGLGTPTNSYPVGLNQPPTLPLGTGQPYAYAQPPTGFVPPSNYSPTIYPNSSPNVLFPGTGSNAPLSSPWNLQPTNGPYGNSPYVMPPGSYGNSWDAWWYNTSNAMSNQTNQVIRLFQGPRFRHTWLPGNDDFSGRSPTQLEINDTDVSLVFAVPSFLGTNQPLYIIPSYSQHEWEGPSQPGSDLPGSAFSAFLDTAWQSNPMQTLGAELGFRVGVFSAFDAISSESIRFQGKGIARLRLTPTSTLKAGVYYIDRNRVKLLPAVGLLWMPNPDTRFDIFFPEPKLAHYVSTIGNTDFWWYLTGNYGGGAWTIKQTDGSSDEIDINDIRIMLGVEYGRSDQIRQGFRVGFLEAGYAFNRELLYRNRSSSNLDLDNSLVFRAGLAY